MKRFAISVCVLLLMAPISCTKQGSQETARPVSKVTEKSPAPDITVKDLKGGAVTLSSLKGKVVLLNFWATWCPPCREEIPSMVRLDKAMAGKPFRMLAVSIDEGGTPAVESFLKESGHGTLPVFLDADGAAPKTYGITGVPETFIIDKNGILVKKVIGPMAWDSAEAVSFLEGLMK